MARATAVVVDGPFSGGLDWRGEREVPEWVVCPMDNDGNVVGACYSKGSYRSAVALGEKMARTRGVELVLDGGPA